jgi:hypothetical protein
MSQGIGNVVYTSPPDLSGSGSGTVNAANNGLSLFNINTVVLGQDVGDATNKGQILTDREIPMNAHVVNWNGGQHAGYGDLVGLQSFVNFENPDANTFRRHAEFHWSNNDVTHPDIPFRFCTAETDNGDGTFDHIFAQGFNIDHSDTGAFPGFFRSREYLYLSDFFELHEQFQAYGEETRLQSFTYVYSGIDWVNDTCLVFFSGTSYEFRTLDPVGQVAIFAIGGSAVNKANFEFSSLNGSDVGRFQIDPVAHQWVFESHSGLTDLLIQGFTSMEFGGTANSPRVVSDVFFTKSIHTINGQILTVDNDGGSLDLTIDWLASRNVWNTKFSGATAEWTDTIPSPNGYTRGFKVAGGIMMLEMTNNGNAVFGIPIVTPDPGSGTAPVKLGTVQAAAVTLDAANYWEVMINGVLKKVALVN